MTHSSESKDPAHLLRSRPPASHRAAWGRPRHAAVSTALIERSTEYVGSTSSPSAARATGCATSARPASSTISPTPPSHTPTGRRRPDHPHPRRYTAARTDDLGSFTLALLGSFTLALTAVRRLTLAGHGPGWPALAIQLLSHPYPTTVGPPANRRHPAHVAYSRTAGCSLVDPSGSSGSCCGTSWPTRRRLRGTRALDGVCVG